MVGEGWGGEGGGRRLHSESVARDHRLHTTTDRAVCFGAFPSFNFSPRTEEEVGSQNFPDHEFLYTIIIILWYYWYRIKKFNGDNIFNHLAGRSSWFSLSAAPNLYVTLHRSTVVIISTWKTRRQSFRIATVYIIILSLLFTTAL